MSANAIIATEEIEWRADLPDDEMRVLVTTDDDEVTLGYRDGGVWRCADNDLEFSADVVAWAECPMGAKLAKEAGR